jgi:hypothetical protein
MKNAYLTTGSASNIGDLLGSVPAVAAVIDVLWPNRVHCRRPAPAVRPRTALRAAGDGWRRGLLHPQSARPVVGVSTSRIGHWQSKATFRTAWASGDRNLTQSLTSSAMPWTIFSLAPDWTDRGRIARRAAPELSLYLAAPSIPG